MNRDELRTFYDVLSGDRRCLFGSGDQVCGRPAIVHVLMLDHVRTMACDRHAGRWALRRHLDKHPIGGECGLPGTTWVYGTDDRPGRCVIEGLDMPDLFASADELAGNVA